MATMLREGNTETSRSEAKNWCFTEYKDEPKFNETEMGYLIYQKEKCPKTGNEHYQGYVQFRKKKRLTACKKLFNNSTHFEISRGSPDQASNYCKKKESQVDPPKEFGQITRQGQRTDLIKSCELIRESKFGEIPDHMYVKYHRGFHALFNKINEPKHRPDLKVYWFYGESGIGKSYLANKLWPEAYRKPSGKWFDNYMQQKEVILEEIEDDINENELLKWLDIYKLYVPVKGGFTAWNPEVICITSIKSPREKFIRHKEVMRRIHHLHEITIENRDIITV